MKNKGVNMSGKDYEAIAAALKEERTAVTVREDTRRAIANRIADVLKANNPRFDRDRFMTAAGFERIDFKSAGARRVA